MRDAGMERGNESSSKEVRCPSLGIDFAVIDFAAVVGEECC
jgi:hypothetical protein